MPISRLVLLVLLIAASPALAQPQDWTVTLRSAGPVRFGMTVEQAQAAAGIRLLVQYDTDDCGSATVAGGPEGLSFDVGAGRVINGVTVFENPAVQTLSGVGVGSTEAQVRRAYPRRLHVERHIYNEGGHDMVFVPTDRADRAFRVRFETDGRRVLVLHAGYEFAALASEGCI